MPEPGEIKMLKVTDELHTCPACGYALGFHTSFINANAKKDNPIKSTRETWSVILICPECGARYDVGWRVSFAEFEPKFVRTPAVSVVTAKPVPQPDSPPAAPPAPAVLQLPPASENPDEPSSG